MKDWSQFRDFGLYLVTDSDLCLGRPILDVVLAAVQGGVQTVQIREKQGNTRDFLELAKLLVREVQSKNIPIIINDRVDIALASHAAGVHVGQSDMPPEDARKLLGEKAIIGMTAPTMQCLAGAILEPVQYVAVGPVFATQTKKNTAPPWGLDGMRKVRAFLHEKKSAMPFMTIGGINENNAKEILRTGVDSLAIVSTICSAKDPAKVSANLRSLW